MLLKILTNKKNRNTWLVYDNVSNVVYNEEPFRASTREEAINVLEESTLGIFPNGSIEEHVFEEENIIEHTDLVEFIKSPFKYNIISFIDKAGDNISIMFNGIAYLCNDRGNTIQKIKGHM